MHSKDRPAPNPCMVIRKNALKHTTSILLPLYLTKIPAGFPSPADDYLDGKIDLNKYLIKHPSATFIVRVQGDSMLGAGIHENDELIVDRSLEAVPGKIVIAAVDGQLTVKRLQKNSDGAFVLCAENPKYPPITIQLDNDVVIWGVVTKVLHSV